MCLHTSWEGKSLIRDVNAGPEGNEEPRNVQECFNEMNSKCKGPGVIA